MYNNGYRQYSFQKICFDRKGSLAASGDSTSLFAAADEFADLLDEESGDKRDTTSSRAVVNRGKTGTVET